MNSIAKDIARELKWVPKIKAYSAEVHGFPPSRRGGRERGQGAAHHRG